MENNLKINSVIHYTSSKISIYKYIYTHTMEHNVGEGFGLKKIKSEQ